MQATTRCDDSPRQTGCLCWRTKPLHKTTEATITVAADSLKSIEASPAGKWGPDGRFYQAGLNVPPVSPLAPTQWKEMPAKPEGVSEKGLMDHYKP